MNSERQDIIRKLMHNPGMRFNELWNRETPSNRFAYNIKVLEEDGLIKKTDDQYSLTHEGRKYVTYIEGETGKKSTAPLIGAIMVIWDEKQEKILFLRRTKEPFYGYWGLIGGKLKFDQYILDCAKEEIKEETGLICNLELKGLFSSKTFNNNSLSYNHQMFIIKGTNPKGTLLKKTREGESRWVSEEEISSMTIFNDVPYLIKIAKGNGFRWIEADRHQEDDVFKSIELLKDVKF